MRLAGLCVYGGLVYTDEPPACVEVGSDSRGTRANNTQEAFAGIGWWTCWVLLHGYIASNSICNCA